MSLKDFIGKSSNIINKFGSTLPIPYIETINVFDSDGNTASVNSFLECEHYVSGGWDVIPIERAEAFYFDLFSIFAVLSVIVGFIFSKKIKIING